MDNHPYIFQTLFIYVGLIALILCFMISQNNGAASQKQSYRVVAFTFVSLYTLIFGLRYDVGVDYIGYYELESIAEYLRSKNEPIFLGFVNLALYFDNPCILFIICASIQITAVCLITTDLQIMLSILLVFFLHGDFLSWQNGIRQTVCLAVFLCSMKYIFSKKYLYYLLVLLLYFIHNSAAFLVAIPLINIYRKKICNSNNILKIAILFGAIIIGRSFVVDISPYIDFLNNINYADYYTLYSSKLDEFSISEIHFGLGYYINILLSTFLLYYSNEVTSHYKSDFLDLVFTLTYIGMISSNLFIGMQVIGRINYYFTGAFFVFGGYVVHYFLFEKKSFFNSSTTIGLFTMKFIATMYNLEGYNGYFKFFWQKGTIN